MLLVEKLGYNLNVLYYLNEEIKLLFMKGSEFQRFFEWLATLNNQVRLHDLTELILKTKPTHD